MSFPRNKPSSSSGSVVDNEVSKLLKKNAGSFEPEDFVRLRNKYDNEELVDKIQTAYMEAYHKMVRRAKKFAHVVRQKYGSSDYPFHMLLQKAQEYRRKVGMTDVEFAEFKRIYEQELAGTGSPDVVAPATTMMKLLGTVSAGLSTPKMKVSPEDMGHMQEILKSYSANKPLHAQVLLQSIQYKDCDYEALTGEYKRELGHRPGEHIHPVLAALFLPKLKYVEELLLHTNMAGIVKARYNDEPLVSRPDYELFYNLTVDPNDVVCSAKSPIQDLLHRSNVQHQLWNSVLHLRNGQYFGAQFREFINSVDMCKLNKYDNPDLVYGRYDGTVMKRLLACFSFRPTVVATHHSVTPFSYNPYSHTVVPTVMSVQMINMRIPGNIRGPEPVSLEMALQQTQLFLEGGFVVPKHTDIIYSRGVLVFFIDRRSNVMKIPGVRPLNFHAFPTALAGFERINDRAVNFSTKLPIRGDTYKLRSVVLSEINKEYTNHNIVVGSSAAIMIHADPSKGIMADNFFNYNPQGVIDYVPVGEGVPHNAPITIVHGLPGAGPVGESFTEMAQSRGSLFVYELDGEDSFEKTQEVALN